MEYVVIIVKPVINEIHQIEAIPILCPPDKGGVFAGGLSS